MNVVGALDDIAPGECIFSTTFAEDHVFVVTFRQIDPLFVIDLSDATAPTIVGVSNYLQLIDDDILLAVGRDGEANTVLTEVEKEIILENAEPVVGS